MMIYKLFRPEEWAQLQADGETTGAPIDVSDGYVHFSTAAQVKKTAELYFAEVDGLMLLAVPSDPLGDDLTWEPSRGGDLFPHLFRKLRMEDVAWTCALEWVDEQHIFPDLT